MSVRNLNAWVNAGLIDAATAANIRAWEDENSRPLALWAIIGIGALAIGLGLISVVAANWEDVPGKVRLALHLAIMAGLGGFLALRGAQLFREQPWIHEAALFVLGMLGMTFFGHLGQVYQTSSPLWKPLSVWLILFAPLLLLRGQSWLIAAFLMVVLIYASWDFALGFETISGREIDVPTVRIATFSALPVLVTPLAAFFRTRSSRGTFWLRLGQFALGYSVIAASLLVIISGFDDLTRASDGLVSISAQVIQATIGLVAAALVVVAHQTNSGKAAAMILAAAAIMLVLAHGVTGSSLGLGLVFMAFWVGIAAAALYAGWRIIFQLAVAAVAVRLIVLSFELATDLLTSGAGLILSGLLILGIAWIAVRISRQFAPPREAAS